MRAATAIVGAIAVSSILIALAFILSGGNGSSDVARTKTVTKFQEAAKPVTKELSSPQAGGGAVGGPTRLSTPGWDEAPDRWSIELTGGASDLSVLEE